VHTDDFDFALPPKLIAQQPLPERDASRLLHLHKPSGHFEHRTFREFPTLLKTGDVMVFNDSRVLPARLLGKKKGSGGKAELLLVRPDGSTETHAALKAQAHGSTWVCLGQSSKGFREGMELEFACGLTAQVRQVLGGGEYRVQFTSPHQSLEEAIAQAGSLPLPPYIDRAAGREDDERYQTVYARQLGSVAAPTAGLHFTQATFDALALNGIETHFVTLDVGPGTFMPVREGPIANHIMHQESAHISEKTWAALSQAKAQKRRIIAVGTTVVRTLESASGPGRFSTSIFIAPGYTWKMVDALVTNFHLPKSTLVMLVAAFLGREQTLAAYAEAIRQHYRFFSYGDAMFIETEP
jgi:S-adenosylmethionine:tRNA ribosyltransferase-isomerase